MCYPVTVVVRGCIYYYVYVIHAGYSFTDGKFTCIPLQNRNTCGTCLHVRMHYGYYRTGDKLWWLYRTFPAYTPHRIVT